MKQELLFKNGKSEQVAYFAPFKGHIHNPGMGIVSMAISDHMVTGYTPEERAANDLKKPFTLTQKMLEEVTSLSYIDNLYIRVGWNDVQKEKGKLELLPEFEMAVEAAREKGLGWGFRIMQASPSNPGEHLLPDFLADKLPVHPYYDGAFYGPYPKKLPLYTEDYLKYWEEMLLMLGEKYDSDPFLEYGDLSGYGLWGEGHHGCIVTPGEPAVDLQLDSRERKEEIVERLVHSHQRAFSQTPMSVNLILGEYRAALEAIENGSWTRRDSYYQWFEASHAEYGLRKRDDAAMIFETVMPGIQMDDSDDPAFCRRYMDIPDKMCDYGATYGIVGFNIPDTLYADRMMPQLFDPFKKRLGYRLRPSICWVQTNASDKRKSLVLGMVNDGAACPPGTIMLHAACNGETVTTMVNGSLLGHKMYLAELPLPEHAESYAELSMSLKIGNKIRPARFAADCGTKEAPQKLIIRLKH